MSACEPAGARDPRGDTRGGGGARAGGRKLAPWPPASGGRAGGPPRSAGTVDRSARPRLV